jgi:hypothetical protein
LSEFKGIALSDVFSDAEYLFRTFGEIMGSDRSSLPRPLAASGIEGDIEFRLSQCTPCGICVEKRWRRAGTGSASHAMSFDNEAAFLRWCEADAVRFSFPHLHAQLKRHGCALFGTRPGASLTA